MTSGAALADGALHLVDPWIREAPPGMTMLGGYVTLHNTGRSAVQVVGAESAAFGSIELHKTEVVDGTAKMLRQDRLEIPAGGELALKPGGYHLMLMQPKRPLKAGDKVDITFKLGDKTTQSASFEVRKATGAAADGDAHQHHHH